MRLLSIAACGILLCGTATARTPGTTPKTPVPYMLTQDDLKSLNGTFDMIDVDHDDSLTRIEFVTFAQRHGMGQLVREKSWKALDANRNGRIERAELLKGASLFMTNGKHL